MFTTIAVSIITAFIVTRITIAVYFVAIDKYTDHMTSLVKQFFSDLISILDKRM